jgi:hypothetical protein
MLRVSLELRKGEGEWRGEGQKLNSEVVGEGKASENLLKEWTLNVGEGGAETGGMFSHQGLFSNSKGCFSDLGVCEEARDKEPAWLLTSSATDSKV